PLPSKAAAPASPAEGIANLATRLRSESKAQANSDILEPIVSARQETQLLRALAADLAQSTHLDEVASVIYKCLGQKISFDTLGLYVRREEYLEPVYFLGAHLSLFNKKAFPITEALSGWVTQHGRPIVNGNVSI